jgi:hypothetical protein
MTPVGSGLRRGSSRRAKGRGGAMDRSRIAGRGGEGGRARRGRIRRRRTRGARIAADPDHDGRHHRDGGAAGAQSAPARRRSLRPARRDDRPGGVARQVGEDALEEGGQRHAVRVRPDLMRAAGLRGRAATPRQEQPDGPGDRWPPDSPTGEGTHPIPWSGECCRSERPGRRRGRPSRPGLAGPASTSASGFAAPAGLFGPATGRLGDGGRPASRLQALIRDAMKSAKNRLEKSLGAFMDEPSSRQTFLRTRVLEWDGDASRPGAAVGWRTTASAVDRRARGAIGAWTLWLAVIGRGGLGGDRGWNQAPARGGRSNGEVPRRGWGRERSSHSPIGSGPREGATAAGRQPDSLVRFKAGTEAGGRPCRREQLGPEQAGAGRGAVGRGCAPQTTISDRDSRGEADRSSERSAFEVTPWPQLARAGGGAKHHAARSRKMAPANGRLACPDDRFRMESKRLRCDGRAYQGESLVHRRHDDKEGDPTVPCPPDRGVDLARLQRRIVSR